jgi:hypothetical protein
MRRQLGISLVSLMVGLTLSTISVLALMSLYRGIVAQSSGSTGASARARDDGLLSTAQLSVELELQRAGYGFGTSSGAALVNTNLILVNGATWTRSGSAQLLGGTARTIGASAQTGNALAWDYNLTPGTASAARCRALIATGGGLVSLKPSSDTVQCAASSWASLQWVKDNDLVVPGVLLSTAQASVFSVASSSSCWPYGKASTVTAKGTGGSSTQVVVSLSSVSSASSALAGSSATVCLPNLN